MVWETVAKSFAEYTAPHVLKLVAHIGKPAVDQFIATCTNVFSSHLEASVASCSYMKNILYREERVPLRDQYVNCTVSSSLRIFPDHDVVSQIKTFGARYLVTGPAGSGKSMIMKWVTLELADSILHHQRIPLFLEVRDLSLDGFSTPFEELLFASTSSEHSKATYEQFLIGLKGAMFAIVLDGLDEVPPKSRKTFFGALGDFGRRFPHASIVCSSRPDNQVESQVDLSVLRLQPMNLDQTCEVIKKSRFDDVKKKHFIAELRSGLFEENEKLLSTPLISIIWLITFDHDPMMKKNLSSFYNQVFEALFFRHDSSKGVFVREHLSGLAIDQFEAVLKGVGFRTYADGDVRISYTEAVRIFREVLAALSLPQVNPEHVLLDCFQSISLLYEDGGVVDFIHRSFQEYFAAKFVAAYQGPNYGAVIARLSERASVDRVIYYVKELDRNRFLTEWLVPELRKLLLSLKISDEPWQYLAKIVDECTLGVDEFTSKIVEFKFSRKESSLGILLSLLTEDDAFLVDNFDDLTFAGIEGSLLEGIEKKANKRRLKRAQIPFGVRGRSAIVYFDGGKFNNEKLIRFFEIRKIFERFIAYLENNLDNMENEIAKRSGLFESSFSKLL